MHDSLRLLLAVLLLWRARENDQSEQEILFFFTALCHTRTNSLQRRHSANRPNPRQCVHSNIMHNNNDNQEVMQNMHFGQRERQSRQRGRQASKQQTNMRMTCPPRANIPELLREERSQTYSSKSQEKTHKGNEVAKSENKTKHAQAQIRHKQNAAKKKKKGTDARQRLRVAQAVEILPFMMQFSTLRARMNSFFSSSETAWYTWHSSRPCALPVTMTKEVVRMIGVERLVGCVIQQRPKVHVMRLRLQSTPQDNFRFFRNESN